MKLIKGERGIMNTLQWLVIKVRELLANKDNSSGGGTGIQSIQEGDNISIDNTDPLNPIVSTTGGGTTGDSYITTLSYTNEDLGVETMEEVTEQLVVDYINSLGLVKNANEIYEIEISEPGPLDYDMVHTLTFAESDIGDDFPITLFRGSNTLAGTVFTRNGTSGAWQTVTVASHDYYDDEGATRIPITSTKMQVGHSFNISGNNVMYAGFRSSQVLTIGIKNNPLPNNIGNYFMESYAKNCTSLTSLGVPDTSNVTTVGTNFMDNYASGCYSLTSLKAPDLSNVVTINNQYSNFMGNYARNCTSLTSLDAPKFLNLTTVGSNFMLSYAYNCNSLTSLGIPNLPYLESQLGNLMYYYAYDCTSLTSLKLPSVGWFATNNVNWYIPLNRLGILKGKVINPTDLSGWQALTTSGKTLYINQIRSSSDITLL